MYCICLPVIFYGHILPSYVLMSFLQRRQDSQLAVPTVQFHFKYFSQNEREDDEIQDRPKEGKKEQSGKMQLQLILIYAYIVAKTHTQAKPSTSALGYLQFHGQLRHYCSALYIIHTQSNDNPVAGRPRIWDSTAQYLQLRDFSPC